MNVARNVNPGEMQSKRELFPKLQAIQGFNLEQKKAQNQLTDIQMKSVQ